VFGDRWRLETAPPAAFVFSAPPPPPAVVAEAAGQARDGFDRQALGGPSLAASAGMAGGGQTTKGGEPVADRVRSNQDGERDGGERAGASGVSGKSLSPTSGGGGMEVDLRGVALAPDTRGHARKRLEAGVSRGVLAAKVEEIVREVIRDVRTPVREEEVRAGYARRRLAPRSPLLCCHLASSRFRSCCFFEALTFCPRDN